MSGKLSGAADGGDSARASGAAAEAGGSAQKTPNESTLLLPTPATHDREASAESSPASIHEDDLPRLQAGVSLAGRFTILRFIARGGMGAVYEANDVILRSRVALKVIRARIAADAAAMERFRREVLLARRVSHPNVCRVYELYDATTATGVPIHFLTMELLEGETISQCLSRQGRLTTAEALPLARQMCEGLAAAHAEGVIHRDFKSSNVLLVERRQGPDEATAPSTRVAITDFGIARAVQANGAERADSPLTGRADILGTPEYMAPEQVTGGTVTQATDIYALGVVLYEMVTGKRPFTGDTPLAAAAKRLREAPQHPEATTPGLDERWSATILRCLAREPERRFKSALDILSELETPPRRWPRWASTGALVLVLALTGAASVWLFRGLHPPKPQTAVPARPRPVLAILGVRNELASPDLGWLPTAVSESLGHELAAAETSLRVIPADRVGRVQRSLGLSEDAVSLDNARERMQGLLGANVLVYGTVRPTVPGSTSVALSLRVLDALSRRELASLEADLGPAGASLSDAVSGLGERVRELLGVSLSPQQAAALSASRPRNLSATRFYAQGVMSLRKFEYKDARNAFEAALATDGNFLDAQRRVVQTWEGEGNRKRARDAAERIRLRSSGLTPRQMAEAEAKFLSLGPEPDKGTEALQTLFDATPDDIELGLALLDESPPRTADAIVNRLRELPAPASDDVRLNSEEALRQLGNPKRLEELLAPLKARVQALGARSDLAWALWLQASMLEFAQARPAEAEPLFEEAARLFEQAGELPWAAFMKASRAQLLSTFFPPSVGLKAHEETASLYRRLGDHAHLRDALVYEAELMGASGDYELEERKLHEALSESEAISETPGFAYKMAKGWLVLDQADMGAVRDAIRALRAEPEWVLAAGHEPFVRWLEARALIEQDRFQEAEVVMPGRGSPEEADAFGRNLCGLACEEGHPLKGLECFAKRPSPKGVDGLDLAKCRYLTGDLDGAERAALEARADAKQRGHYSERILANVYVMRVRAARGQTDKAKASLRADLAEAEGKKAKALAFEVALALGEVEFSAGRVEGRPRLVKLEQEAKSKEFFRIGRLAREALDRKPLAKPTRTLK